MYKTYIKRLLDIVISLVLIIVFSPVIIVTAILIRLDSNGPILADVPERIGQNGKKFKMYKFRSMIVNAHYILRRDPKYKKLYEEYKRESYKLVNDPRVTRIGKFIRKHSIDEIPQLFNVLKGEMSIVGPRATYDDELDGQQKRYPHIKNLVDKVLSVKPGITGLWQVTGRSEINFDKKMGLDAQYVDDVSFWLDLSIMIRTPLVMVTGQGAI